MEMINDLKKASYQEKTQFFTFFLNVAQRNRREFDEEDRSALMRYISELSDTIPRMVPDLPSYRDKDVLFTCADHILHLVMALFPSAADADPTLVQKLTALSEMVTRLRTVETALDSVMEKDTVTAQDINRILYWVRQSSDEYQRGRLSAGLIHYAADLEKLTPEAKEVLQEFLSAEFHRWLNTENPDRDILENLELTADAVRYFPSDSMVDGLRQAIKIENNTIRYFTLESLIYMKQPVSAEVIHSLAADPVHANNTYNLLVQEGMAHLYPEEYTQEEYQAKSALIHWLTYPTELNQAPDETEYLGSVKFLLQRHPYHIFKFRSGSPNLSEDAKNQWLIGWSSRSGNTFSNFDKLSDYQMDTLEKTLKNIKKKLIK